MEKLKAIRELTQHNSGSPTRLLIVGTGLAGLMACWEAVQAKIPVTLITSGKFGGGATFTPIKGTLGIQVTGENDEENFMADMAQIGKGFVNESLAALYAKVSPHYIEKLRELGFSPRLRQDHRPACFAKHWRPIYLIDQWEHHRKIIYEKLQAAPNLEILEDTTVVKLFKDEQGITGALLHTPKGFALHPTRGIIMATGGIASLYKHSLYPQNIAGIGQGVLLDLGVEFTNLEFIQFIPAFLKPKYNILFGEHTLKYCLGLYADQELIYPGVQDPRYKALWQQRSTYAPFSCDFPCASIDYAIYEANQRNLDFTLQFQPELYENQEDFYKVYLDWLKNKIGINMLQPVKIAHFAHSCNGGAVVDTYGATNIPGLYAIGELMAGAEGANRLGGNSIGLSMVMGSRAVKHWHDLPKQAIDELSIATQAQTWLDNLKHKALPSLATIQQIMEQSGNIIRHEQGLIKGLNALAQGETLPDLATMALSYNQQLAAQALLVAMLNQTASVGAHYRQDYPQGLAQGKQFLRFKNLRFQVRWQPLSIY